MGCAECELLKSLKFHRHIESLIGIDINESLLQSNQNSLQPLITDYLHRRSRPLKIQLFKGSIDEADSRMMDCDLFSCIEVIEHLYPSVLERVPAAIFQKLRPQAVIISTPNSDFNVLFPEFVGFRHFDHKFEWSRQEFQAWCFSICCLYHYEVEFSGVGDPPANMTYLGHCSQIAIFRRIEKEEEEEREEDEEDDSNEEKEEERLGSPYELIYECEFPYEPDPPTQSERLSNEAEYYLRVLVRRERNRYLEIGGEPTIENGSHENSGLTESPRHRDFIRIELNELLMFPVIQELTNSVTDISEALRQHSSLILSEDSMNAIFYEESSSEEEEEEEEREGAPPSDTPAAVTEEESWD
ncbi:PREDICTED: small RNA 2'-O-methyltransferase-like [Amphimedon queenslandica]|uniref:Small RNA 2'-O-methyltransferase n=1 Tax=Amphimedon queenslandica TaxID=400682 RepID=A0AAN0JQY1_AMPQE|nr:PREDICTED: small RNA 2'-O-methyltransferase-like [Amphimedon queenslandica]|eukprot:XP_019859243.1 PREDICTED: small RNA 2'-O-methyltransferase-like [Amphimedon queenslandica]